jgi:hypothetical protein
VVAFFGARPRLCLLPDARSSEELPCAYFPRRRPWAAASVVEDPKVAGDEIQSEGDGEDARWRPFRGFEVR